MRTREYRWIQSAVSTAWIPGYSQPQIVILMGSTDSEDPAHNMQELLNRHYLQIQQSGGQPLGTSISAMSADCAMITLGSYGTHSLVEQSSFTR